MHRLKDYLIEQAFLSKWWLKDKSRDLIRESMIPILKEGKEKKNNPGERWAPSIYVRLNVNQNTGLCKYARIVDANDQPISYHEVVGKRWDFVTIRPQYVWFRGASEWGVTVSLVGIKLSADQDTSAIVHQERENYERDLMFIE